MTPDNNETPAVTLKPCPFCGGKAKTHGPYGWYSQWCISHNCEAFYNGGSEAFKGFPSEAEAIAAWNTRQPGWSEAIEAAAKFVREWNGGTADGNTFLIADELLAALSPEQVNEAKRENTWLIESPDYHPGKYFRHTAIPLSRVDGEYYPNGRRNLQHEWVDDVHKATRFTREEADAEIAGATDIVAVEHIFGISPEQAKTRPWCETCGKTVAEVLCPTCAKWWNDNAPEQAIEPRPGDYEVDLITEDLRRHDRKELASLIDRLHCTAEQCGPRTAGLIYEAIAALASQPATNAPVDTEGDGLAGEIARFRNAARGHGVAVRGRDEPPIRN